MIYEFYKTIANIESTAEKLVNESKSRKESSC